MPQTYDRILQTISKPPDQRTVSEISKLTSWFRKKSKLFVKLKSEILQDILRNCGFVSRKVDDVIILQGDLGECFYVILRGKVAIYNLSKEDEKITKLSETDLRNDKQQLDRNQLGNFVCNLVPGDPFGEVALLSKDSIRTATVVADELTDLMVVHKSLYERSVKDILSWEFQQKIAFICANPLFRGWSHKYKHQLAMAVYKTVLSYDEILIRQGEPVNSIFFILSGQVQIICNPRQHISQYPQLMSHMKNKGIKSTHQPELSKPLKNIPRLKWQKQALKNIHLCYLGINEIIGDVEVLLKLDTSLQTVITSEITELIVLEIKHFERLFVRHHIKTVDCMTKQLEVKLYSRQTHLRECHQEIPLLEYLHNKLKQNSKLPNKSICREEPQKYHFQLSSKDFWHKRLTAGQYISQNMFFAARQKEFYPQTKKKVQKCLFPQISDRNGVSEQSSNAMLINQRKSRFKVEENYYVNSLRCIRELQQCVKNWLMEVNSSKISALPPLYLSSFETLQEQSKARYKISIHSDKYLDLDCNVESSDEDNNENDNKINSEKLERCRFLLTL
ncbi:uncharacterized protein LOC115231060 [Argonauta hians]